MVSQKIAELQENLIKEINEDFRDYQDITGVNSLSQKLETALKKVPRHFFTPSVEEAYLNQPLPIGFGQTISQPFIVAIMTELLYIQKSDSVLEIGTGSGYQAAILGELAKEVYSVEIVEELASKAFSKLKSLGYKNIHVLSGDGKLGWPEFAPYEKIIITAAAKEIPQILISQLKSRGRIVLPLVIEPGMEMMSIIDKDELEIVKVKTLFPVRFVPFI